MKKQRERYPEAPGHLSDRSKRLWHELGPVHMRSIGRQALFQAALEALDRAEDARALIATDGLVAKTTSTGALHLHPAVRVERESRTQFAKLWGSLELNWDDDLAED